MPDILGAHIQVRAGRYVAGFAWLDAGAVRGEPTMAAPAEPHRDLSELFQRALELARRKPMKVAILKNEALRAPASLRVASRAEGVVLAAMQQLAIPCVEWVGAGLYRPAGMRAGRGVTTKAAMTALVTIAGLTPLDDAQAAAVAVAVAQAKSDGLL